MFASDRFVTVLNIANVQDQLVALALVALAQTVVILSGGIDLSFAGLLGLLSVLFATFAGVRSGDLRRRLHRHPRAGHGHRRAHRRDHRLSAAFTR